MKKSKLELLSVEEVAKLSDEISSHVKAICEKSNKRINKYLKKFHMEGKIGIDIKPLQDKEESKQS
jgi:hypothetical protein